MNDTEYKVREVLANRKLAAPYTYMGAVVDAVREVREIMAESGLEKVGAKNVGEIREFFALSTAEATTAVYYVDHFEVRVHVRPDSVAVKVERTEGQ